MTADVYQSQALSSVLFFFLHSHSGTPRGDAPSMHSRYSSEAAALAAGFMCSRSSPLNQAYSSGSGVHTISGSAPSSSTSKALTIKHCIAFSLSTEAAKPVSNFNLGNDDRREPLKRVTIANESMATKFKKKMTNKSWNIMVLA